MDRFHEGFFHAETRLNTLNFHTTDQLTDGSSLVKKVRSSIDSIDGSILIINTKISSSFNPRGRFVLDADFTSVFLHPDEANISADNIDSRILQELSRFALKEHALLVAVLTRLAIGTPYITNASADLFETTEQQTGPADIHDESG